MPKVYVLTRWDYGESKIIGVATTIPIAQALADRTTQDELAGHGWTSLGSLVWYTPENAPRGGLTANDVSQHRGAVAWAECQEHDDYEIEEHEVLA